MNWGETFYFYYRVQVCPHALTRPLQALLSPTTSSKRTKKPHKSKMVFLNVFHTDFNNQKQTEVLIPYNFFLILKK